MRRDADGHSPTRETQSLAASAAFVSAGIGVLVLLVVFGPRMDDPLQTGVSHPARAVGYVLMGLSWWAVGTIEWLRGHRRTGAELLAVAAVVALGTLIVTRVPVAFTVGSMVVALGAPLATYVLLRYPDVPLRRWSERLPVVLAAIAAATAVPVHLFYSPHLYGCPQCPADLNVLFWRPLEGGLTASLVVGGLAIVGSLLALAVVSIRRYLRAGPVARRVVGPVTTAALVYVAGTALYLVDQNSDVSQFAPMQSYDALGGIAFLAAATAAPFALLAARARERDLVGRLQHLAEPDTGPAFEAALRHLVGDPDLRVGHAMPDGRYRGVDGQVLELPPPDDRTRTVTSLGEAVGVLVHDAALVRERSVLDALVAVAGLAVHNQVLAEEVTTRLEEVRASRARLVEASDDARRRVERDLHDGAQQRLVTLAVQLRGLQAELRSQAGDPDRVPTGDHIAARDHVVVQLDEACNELQLALLELRNLARGVYPTALMRGLRPALDSLFARAQGVADAEIQLDRRLPPPVEAAAYFVVAEAVTNAGRHAGSSVRVRVRDEGGWLVAEVEDDGSGGADPSGGGLSGLADRVAALGGDFAVHSPPGAGTRISARLPTPDAG